MDFEISLPIAGVVLNPFILVGLGVVGGFLAGLLGIGGGVIITPALMMMGVPPVVAIASQINHAIGTCLTGFLNYRRHNDVDFQLGWILLIGGITGAIVGVYILDWLNSNGQVMMIVTLSYLAILGIMGTFMMRQSIRSLIHYHSPIKTVQQPDWIKRVPGRLYFYRTRVEMSWGLPLLVGLINGILTACLGVGNGVFMMPVITYLIGRNSPVVYGTVLLAGLGMTTLVTLIYAFSSHPMDLVLVMILLMGGIIGTQIGVRFAYSLPRPYIGLMGACMIFGICLKFAYQFSVTGHLVSQNNIAPTQCVSGFCSWLPAFAESWPIVNALMGIGLAAIFALVMESVVHRFVLISRAFRE